MIDSEVHTDFKPLKASQLSQSLSKGLFQILTIIKELKRAESQITTVSNCLCKYWSQAADSCLIAIMGGPPTDPLPLCG